MNYANAVTMLELYESMVPHMYLDTKGLVTIAVGQMLASPQDAAMLAMYSLPTPPAVDLTASASVSVIAAEYAAMKKLTPAQSVNFYRAKATLFMKRADMEALLLKRIGGFEDDLEGQFADWETFPEPAQLALLDMVFNLGSRGLFSGYPKLMAAAKRHDWATCAAECFRNGPGPVRNEGTKQRFLAAVPLENPGI